MVSESFGPSQTVFICSACWKECLKGPKLTPSQEKALRRPLVRNNEGKINISERQKSNNFNTDKADECVRKKVCRINTFTSFEKSECLICELSGSYNNENHRFYCSSISKRFERLAFGVHGNSSESFLVSVLGSKCKFKVRTPFCNPSCQELFKESHPYFCILKGHCDNASICCFHFDEISKAVSYLSGLISVVFQKKAPNRHESRSLSSFLSLKNEKCLDKSRNSERNIQFQSVIYQELLTIMRPLLCEEICIGCITSNLSQERVTDEEKVLHDIALTGRTRWSCWVM